MDESPFQDSLNTVKQFDINNMLPLQMRHHHKNPMIIKNIILYKADFCNLDIFMTYYYNPTQLKYI